MDYTAWENVVFGYHGDPQFQSGLFMNNAAIKEDAAGKMERFDVRPPNPRLMAKNFSGGNQQKIVLGKWLAMKPKLLMLDEPTRGIDIGAKREIYKLMEKLAGEGMAILFVSSEMEEVLGMSDRTYVMHEGKISGELRWDQLSEEAIMNLATGNVQAA